MRVKFTDLVDFTGNPCRPFNGQKSYVSTGCVHEDHIAISEVELVNYKDKPSRANLEVVSGDIIFAKMQSTKKTLLIDEGLEQNLYSTGFCAVRPKDNLITKDCLYYLLSSQLFLNAKDKNCSGATQKAITKNGFGLIELNVPSLKEQATISKILNRLAHIMQLRNRQLQLLDNFIKARFVEMFEDKKGGRSSTLGQECAFYSGTGFPHKYQGNESGDYPFYKVGDISKNVQRGNKKLMFANNYIDESARRIINGHLIPEGTVVFAKIGEALRLNRRAITSTPCLIDNNAMGIKPVAKDLSITYFFEYMKNLDMQKLCAATTVPSVRKSALEAETIHIPNIEHQKEFAGLVDQIDKSKFALSNELTVCDFYVRLIYDSIMHGSVNLRVPK